MKIVNIITYVILTLLFTVFSLNLEGQTEAQLRYEVRTLLKKSRNSLNSETDSSFIFSKEAMALAGKIGYERGVADAWEAIAMNHYSKHQFVEAVESINKYLTFYENLKDDSILVNGYCRIAGYCMVTNNLEIAGSYLNKARSIATGSGRDDLIGLCAHSYGQYYYNLRNFPKALTSCLDALNKIRNQRNPDFTARIYRKIGDSYVGIRDFRMALMYYDSSMRVFSDLNDMSEIAIDLTRIGHVYSMKGNIRKSLSCNFRALEYRKITGNNTFIGSSYANIGSSYIKLQMPDSAIYFLGQAENSLINSLNYRILENVYDLRYRILKDEKRFDEALKYLELYQNLHEKVRAEENQVNIGTIAVSKYISEKEMENQIQREELKVKNFQLAIFGLVLFFLLLILSITMIVLRRIRKQKQIQEELNTSLAKEITVRKKAEADLQVSEQRYRFITEHSPDLIIREDIDFRKSFVSPSSIQLLGYSPGEMLNVPGFLEFIHPESLHDWIGGILQMKKTRKPARIVIRAKRKNNSLLWVECMINPVFSEDGLVEMVTVLRDITERVEYQEEIEEYSRHKELLMREIHHRVKNNLGMLLSIVRMHRNRYMDAGIHGLLDDLQFRVQTMAMVHNQLHTSKNIDELSVAPYLSGLVKSIMKSFDSGKAEVFTFFYEEMVHVDVLLPLGLIVNELITNIFKHAFPGNMRGHLWIRYERLEEPGCDHLRKISVSDDGVGFPADLDFGNLNSLGSQLIISLTKQLCGEIMIDGSNGGSFTITLPVRAGKKAEVNTQLIQ